MQQTSDQAITANWSPARGRPRFRLRRIAPIVPLLLIVLLFVLTGLFAPLLTPHDPSKVVLHERLLPPVWQSGGSTKHLLGTDHLGRDELSRLISGARISLIVVGITIPVSALFGTLVGIAAGWRLGVLDSLLMRVVDLQLALPALLFAILLAAVFGPRLRNVIILIVIWGWSSYARLVRGEVLSLRERDFVTAARATGANDPWLIVHHVLPNLINTVVILATLEIAAVILIEASLSFLGIGVAPGTASWGTMIAEG